MRNGSGKKMVVGERNVQKRQNENRVNYGEIIKQKWKTRERDTFWLGPRRIHL